MAQTGISGSAPESMINIFPNPCIGDTYLYTDDLEAGWVSIHDMKGNEMAIWPIQAGKTLHINLALTNGTYLLVLKNIYFHQLGSPKTLFVSEAH